MHRSVRLLKLFIYREITIFHRWLNFMRNTSGTFDSEYVQFPARYFEDKVAVSRVKRDNGLRK